jgi:hypothetical protein
LGTLWPASGSTGGAAITVANTMQVSIAPGTAAVALGTAGALTQLCRWDAAEVVTLAAAPPAGSSRTDLVVLQVRDNTLDSGGNNDFIFQAIAGAGGTPGPGAVPAVPNNAYAVAQLTIPGGAANLNGVTVVDRRANTGLGTGFSGRVFGNTVTAQESTASTTYVDLTTPGPTVTLWVPGTSVLIMLAAGMQESAASQSAAMSYAVSGASTIAAGDTTPASMSLYNVAAGTVPCSSQAVLGGLTAGLNTFTAKYRTTSAASTAYFGARSLVIIPL